jgi:hypothetical protein
MFEVRRYAALDGDDFKAFFFEKTFALSSDRKQSGTHAVPPGLDQVPRVG